MPLRKPGGLGGLQMPVERQSSFHMTETGTFSQDGLTLGKKGLSSPAGALTNLHLEDLEVGKQLGFGASSKVYLANHTATGTLLAVKALQADLAGNKDSRHMLLNEVKLVHTSQSEHLVKFYDAFLVEGLVYLAFEYMDVGSLENVFKRVAASPQPLLPEPVMAQFATQMTEGLAFLHKEKHAVHRDLKPANVLCNSYGQVKLSDFGISKQLETTGAVSLTQCGTTNYMAPERIRGEAYSYSADIWSLGLIILEGMCGGFPYPPITNMFDVLKFIVDGPLPTERPEVQQRLSVELLDLAGGILRKDAAYRPDVLAIMQHPFIMTHRAAPFDLGAYLKHLMGA